MSKKKNKRPLLTDDLIKSFEDFVTEFKEESDRSAVVLITSRIDYLLYQLLTKYFLPNSTTKDELFDGDSPLSTLSSKINISHRLGLIDSEFGRVLHLMRKIRNDFAHEVSSAKLDQAPHKDRIAALVSKISSYNLFDQVKSSFFNDISNIKANYFTTAAIIIVRLDTLFLKVKTISQTKAYPIISQIKKG